MLRALILLALIAGAALVAAPFLLTSLATDQSGITIPGRVYSKSETVTVHEAQWDRSPEITFQYDAPDSATVGFFGVRLTSEEYDGFHKGQQVSLHYLPRDRVPTVPLARILLEVHALPTVRLASHETFTNLRRVFSGKVVGALELIAGLIVGLFILRKSGSPLFKWVLGAAVLGAVALVFVYDFPQPTSQPATDVREATATVKSIDQIDRLFSGKRSHGFIADQPVDVVGLEFVPAGRVEPVVAVDLIDAGSISGLKIHSTVPIQYEAAAPRTAYVRGATRAFVSRNIRGIVVECVLSLAVLAGLLLAAQWIRAAFNRLIGRNGPRTT